MFVLTKIGLCLDFLISLKFDIVIVFKRTSDPTVFFKVCRTCQIQFCNFPYNFQCHIFCLLKSPSSQIYPQIWLKNVLFTRSVRPPGPIYQLLTTSPAWPGLNSPPKVLWWAELSISVPENGPFFKSKIEKNFRRFFFLKFFQRANCFYGFKK